MESRVLTLIQNEDPRQPLTDDELATRLGLRRDQVTILRQQAGIPDSRERRRLALTEAIAKLHESGAADLSDRELTRLVNEQGFAVSRQVVSQCRREVTRDRATPPAAPPVRSPRPAAARPARAVTAAPAPVPLPPAEGSAFDRLVGASGSLKPVIEQARAAVLYPPHGLHALILGATGVGKSELAKTMFEFAQESGRVAPGARFVAFNCAEYAENPQLLVAQLFGVTKGAYTGATADRPGLVEQADGGILFLDEVHRLPPDGQEILYHLIDHGTYRRLGEADVSRKATVMIVAATTEEVDSALLAPFRRRIPMVVHLPALVDRPIAERLEYLQWVLSEEASRTGLPIRVMADAVKALLLYDAPGNIGGVRGDLQVSCARAFVASVTTRAQSMTLRLADLPPHVTRGLLRIEGRRREMEALVPGDIYVAPGIRPPKPRVKDTYTMPRDIYEYVERRHDELETQGIPGSERGRVLAGELEARLQAFIRQVQTAPLASTQADLASLVGAPMVQAATRMVEIAGRRLGVMDDRLLYCLATHLSAALERIREGRRPILPQLSARTEYPREWEAAREMVAAAEQSLGLSLPPEEITYVALYLRSFSDGGETEPRIGVVVLSHGRVAGAMAEVANRLLGVTHARAVEMSLDEPPELALERARAAVAEAQEGRGVLLLADMGSLVTFGDLISAETGIPTRTVERVDTTVVLDAVRRAMLPGATLDEVVAALPGGKTQAPTSDPGRPRAVLAVCITGQGAARRIEQVVRESVPDLPVITEGLIAPDHLQELADTYEFVATVGTVDPGLPGVPFISAHELMHGSGSARLRLLTGTPVPARPPSVALRDVLDPDLLLPQAHLTEKRQVLAALSDLLVSRGYARQGFLESVLERESMGPALLGTRMGIPHAEPTVVRQPGVAVAVLAQPVPWGEGFTVDIVCMLALTAESSRIVLELNELAFSPRALDRLRRAQTKQELMEAFTS